MAVNMSRSQNAELAEGATDGTIKKLRPDTSNQTEDVTNDARNVLHSGVNGFGMATGPKEPFLRGIVRHY